MDYQTLKREMENYPDTMTNAERMKAYAMGQEVDRIPFTLGGAHSLVRLYGYTPGQFRRSLDVQFELAEKIKSDFCGSGMAASTNLSLRGLGEALADGVLRISFCAQNTAEEVAEAVAIINRCAAQLKERTK